MLMEGMQDHLQVDFTLSPLGERTGVLMMVTAYSFTLCSGKICFW